MGPAMLWLENAQIDLDNLGWSSFCSLVDEQFGLNEFNVLLRQLFHVRQTESVADYTNRFTETMHCLLAHSTTWDPALFHSRYVDGLKDEIRVVVTVHNPKDLDTAISLAYLQEDALEILKRREPRRSDNGNGGRSHLRGAMPLPPPPGRPPPTVSFPEEHRGAIAELPRGTPSIDDRINTLRSYRRARGCVISAARSGRMITSVLQQCNYTLSRKCLMSWACQTLILSLSRPKHKVKFMSSLEQQWMVQWLLKQSNCKARFKHIKC